MSRRHPAPLVCPFCGSDEVVLEWETVVAVRARNDRVVLVNVGGVLDALPDGILCDHCGEQPLQPDDAAELADALTDPLSGLGDAVETPLRDGQTLYDAD